MCDGVGSRDVPETFPELIPKLENSEKIGSFYSRVIKEKSGYDPKL